MEGMGAGGRDGWGEEGKGREGGEGKGGEGRVTHRFLRGLTPIFVHL